MIIEKPSLRNERASTQVMAKQKTKKEKKEKQTKLTFTSKPRFHGLKCRVSSNFLNYVYWIHLPPLPLGFYCKNSS